MSKKFGKKSLRHSVFQNKMDLGMIWAWPEVFNMVCLPGWTWPPGVNLVTRVELFPLWGMLTPSLTPRGEHSLLFRRLEGQTENFTPGDNFTPRGQSSPLGDNLPPGGQSLPIGAKLRMGLWHTHTHLSGDVNLCHFSGHLWCSQRSHLWIFKKYK
jgi:hypothetical protein